MRSARHSPESESTTSRPSVLADDGRGHLHPAVDANDLSGLDRHGRAGEQDRRAVRCAAGGFFGSTAATASRRPSRPLWAAWGARSTAVCTVGAAWRMYRQPARSIVSMSSKSPPSSRFGPSGPERSRSIKPPVARQRVEAHGGRTGHRRGQPLDRGLPVGPLDQPQRPRGPLGAEGRAGAVAGGQLPVAQLQALPRGVEPRGRCRRTGVRDGKLAGDRLHTCSTCERPGRAAIRPPGGRSAPRGD